MKENTKEHIKNRMIKNAANMWGVAANEIEMSFDPIVALLIAACASEIEKISGEVDESQMRITEKVIQLMTPEAANGPQPSHAILYAEPIEDQNQIKPEYLFTHRKKVPNNKSSVKYKDIHFSPVQDFNLVNAKVQYLATGNTIIEVEEKKNRHVVTQNLKNSNLSPSSLYVGIVSDLKAVPLKDVSFYFELQGVQDKDLLYHHLRSAEWFTEAAKIDVISGFHNSNDSQSTNFKNIFEDVSDKTNTISQQVLNSYELQFITVKSLADNKGMTSSKFEELEMELEENKIKIEGNIRWVKIMFSRIISDSLLRNIHCSLNSFPVINRELNSFSHQIKEYIHIIPIKTEDLFFDIKSIVNTSGKEYKARSKDNSNDEKGTFVMRSDNIGKLDKRKAKEYIVYLIELLKDESASFSFLNNDFLRKNLKSLNQLIARLEKQVSESSSDVTQTNYVMLKPYADNDRLLVDYWTTNGMAGNNIKSGSELTNNKGLGVKQGSAYLMTTSRGGKNDLTMQDRLNSYRRSLLSRDRIVTKEDVKALCYELYGDKINNVDVRKGYDNVIGLNKGLIQCIEIVLTPNNENNTVTEEWDSTNSNLLYYLKNKSIDVLPYKIKILN